MVSQPNNNEIESAIAKRIEDVKIDVLGDTKIPFVSRTFSRTNSLWHV
jgi:hypothetical protein